MKIDWTEYFGEELGKEMNEFFENSPAPDSPDWNASTMSDGRDALTLPNRELIEIICGGKATPDQEIAITALTTKTVMNTIDVAPEALADIVNHFSHGWKMTKVEKKTEEKKPEEKKAETEKVDNGKTETEKPDNYTTSTVAESEKPMTATEVEKKGREEYIDKKLEKVDKQEKNVDVAIEYILQSLDLLKQLDEVEKKLRSQIDDLKI